VALDPTHDSFHRHEFSFLWPIPFWMQTISLPSLLSINNNINNKYNLTHGSTLHALLQRNCCDHQLFVKVPSEIVAESFQRRLEDVFQNMTAFGAFGHAFGSFGHLCVGTHVEVELLAAAGTLETAHTLLEPSAGISWASWQTLRKGASKAVGRENQPAPPSKHVDGGVGQVHLFTCLFFMEAPTHVIILVVVRN
jgi:hypothetical protein